MRAPSCSGSPGTTWSRISVGTTGRSTEAVNNASLPPNQWLTIAASTPARSAIRRTVAPSYPRSANSTRAAARRAARVSAPPGRRPRPRSGRVAGTASILAPGRGRGRCTGRGHGPAAPGWDTDRMTVSSPGRAVGNALPSPAARSSAPALGAVTPSRAEFRELAALHRVIPVTRRLLADDETPVGVYRKLAGDRPGTFLFESAENGRSWSRWSFVGARSAAALTAVDGNLVWTGEVPAGLP